MTSVSPPTVPAEKKKSKGWTSTDDNSCIPLPIQTFLWRQTNPFLGQKVGKLHEASCVTFERVIVQNIMHGLSPSLSDAIQSIPRWRLVRSTFPHVVQCGAALLAERERNLEEGKMSQSLIKMLYILHWMILDSASECMDSEGKGDGANDDTLNQYMFPLNCVQLFVFLFAPLVHTVKEGDITGNIRLENGLNLWQAMWDNRQPDVLCFSAPVKPRKSQLFYVPLLRRTLQQTTAAQDIYMGGNESLGPAGGGSDALGGIYLGGDSPRNVPRSGTFSVRSAVSPTSQISDTKSTETTKEISVSVSEKKEPIITSPSAIKKTIVTAVRSVSDYRKKKSSSKESFHLEEAAEEFKFAEESSGATVDINDRAPLVQLKDICGATWPSLDLPSSSSTQCEIVCELCQTVVYRDGAFLGNCKCDKASQALKVNSLKESFETVDELKFVGEELSMDNDGKSSSSAPSVTRTSPTPVTEIRILSPQSSSISSPPIAINTPRQAPLGSFSLEKRLSFGPAVPATTASGTPVTQTLCCDYLQASYMDVAVLRCLFVRHWSEEGVSWGLRYIYQKLLDISSDLAQKKFFRKRSRSVPVPKLKVTFASPSPLQSKTDLDLDSSDKRRAPGWEQLKLTEFGKMKSRSSSGKGKVAFFVEDETQRGQSDKRGSLRTGDESGSAFLGASTGGLERRRSFTSLKQIFTGKMEERKPLSGDLGGSATYPRFFGGLGDIMSDSWGSLARSATDSNISYLTEYLPEAVGSAPFVHKNGHLNLCVVLKAISGVTERRLSVRVCESVLSVLEILLDLDILNVSGKANPFGKSLNNISVSSASKLGSKQESAKLSTSKEPSRPTNSSGDKDSADDVDVFSLFVNAVIRIMLYLGCQHGCNDGIRSPQADFLRTQSRSCLARVQRADSNNFANSLIQFVETCDLCMLLDFFHAFMGFCAADSGNQPRVRSVSRSSQDNRIKNDAQQGPTYKNNFFAAQRGVEGIIVMTTLKQIVSRFMNSQEELRQPENMGLYSDVRSFMNFLQEYHGHPFRLVELSALVDAMQAQSPTESKTEAERSSGSACDSDSESGSRGASPGHLVRSEQSSKKAFFKKPRDKAYAEDSDPDSSSPGTPRHRLSTEDTPIGSSSSPLLPNIGKKKASKLQMALSILKSVRSEGHVPIEDAEASESDLERSQEDLTMPTIEVEPATQQKKTRRKISFKSAARSLRLLTKVRKRHTTETSDDAAGSRKEQCSLEQLHIPARTLVNIGAVREGARRFAFMLETCKPGTVPDAPLLAALLDLKAPVIARAMIFLECSYFVHRCNKGLWPDWLRMNMPHVRISSVAPLGRGTPSGLRRANLMLRNAGKMFYLWAEAVGSRLEELMQREQINAESMVRLPNDELARKQLRVSDDLEDFLDEAVVNQSGEECPFALKFLACMLIFEVTSFLRDTFQNLPRSRLQSKAQPAMEKLMSHRRWSVLSATFNPSQSGSIQSIADLVAILHPTVAADQRRISFCGPGQDEEESIHSSHSTLDETGASCEKRKLIDKAEFLQHYGTIMGASVVSSVDSEPAVVAKMSRHNVLASAALAIVEPARRLAQGRTKLLKRGATGTGSVRNRTRSFRVKKREKSDMEETAAIPPPMSSLVTDLRRKSLKLMRQLTSHSGSVDHQPYDLEASNRESFKSRKHSVASNETSGEHEPSVERICPADARRVSTESRNDDVYGASSMSDQEEVYLTKNMPWLKTVVHLSNMFNFVCSHQKYCHPFCFQRCYRQSHRLMIGLRKVYGEEFPLEGQLDRRKALIESMSDKPRERSLSTSRRKPSSMPVSRRESALVRGGFDKGSTMHLKNLLIEKLENEEVKETRSTKKHLQEPEKLPEPRNTFEEPPVLKYLKAQVQNPCHSPLSAFLKSALIVGDNYFQDIMPVAWELLLEPDVNVVSCAAAAFILCSVKHADLAVDLIKRQMQTKDPTIRLCAIIRFHVLWRNRYHCWLKMEEGAHLVFKVPPPGIDFTLPSPPIGQSQATVVDPPWMPHIKTKVQELTLKEEEDSTSQTIMTMTKTRRKQKQEIVKRAIQQAEERKSLERQQFFFLATPVQMQAAYEPALFQSAAAAAATADEEDGDNHPVKQQVPVAQPLFPSCLCSVVPLMIQMLDDSEVNHDGIAVGEVVKKVVWSCLVEDCALFIRHFLEKLTTKDKQEELMGLLRKLLQLGPLPAQTAYTLLNYLIGFVMHYVRAPCDGGQDAIGMALSLIWIIIPSVQGLYFKDVKQTLKKEQCDAALLLTANVPMAKKVIIQGPESGSIPSQFNILEDTQFHQILVDCLDYFGIPDDQANSHFLVDAKTGFMHNPNSYVRDFYFFRRSFYPQLNLLQMNADEANARLKQMAFSVKFAEIGRVLLSYNILRSSPDAIIPQRIYFLHEELTRLPAFPRKALEACFGMYRNTWGKELFGVDMMHKLGWAQLTTSMLRGMENPYLFGDLHLFVNVINGVLILHCEDSAVLRHCMATFIEMTYHFKTVFSTNGFFLIMPTILRCYSQHQVNLMLCEVIEFTCKQFYILHRKPFLLQMFGSIAGIIDYVDDELEFDTMRIKASHLFQLLNAMQHLDHQKDILEILSLVRAEKPLKPVDLCYKDDPDTFCILTDALASCVTICAYAPDSRRCYQMLMVMQAILPHYLRQLQEDSKKAAQSSSALKHELNILTTLMVEMKVLINCCEILARNFSGPQRTIDIGNSSSARGRSVACESPQVFEGEESIVVTRTDPKKSVTPNWELNEGMEIQREVFRRPRDALLSLSAVFLKIAVPRIKDLSKVVAEHGKVPDLLDQKAHMKLSEIAHSLLKLAPYDPNTMSCDGLQRYFLDILPLTDWSIENNRSALNFILRRVDKTFAKIVKKSGVRRRINWDALSNWLRGLYATLSNFPYMAHLHFMKTSVQMCLKILIGDPIALGGGDESSNSVAHSAPTTVLSSFSPPQNFCSAVVKLTCLLMQALGEQSFSLEYICSAETLGPLNERIEAVLCHIVIPLFLRVGAAAKENPLRQRDLNFCLNIMLNAINPVLTKATLGPTTSLAATIISRPAEGNRQGSVSVTDRTTGGATASTPKTVRDSIYQTVFLALKVLCLSFEKKLSSEWVRIVRVTKELGLKRTGGPSYWSFVEFALTASTPLRIMLLPFVEHKLLAMKPQSDQEAQWFEFLKDKLMTPQALMNRSSGIYLLELASELRNLKEDLANRPLEGHSRTPTILADLHSDSSSMQSVGRRQSDVRRASSEARRLSFSSKISRLSPSPMGKAGTSPQESIQSPIDDSTIMEETETAEGQLQAPSEPSGDVHEPFSRHKATLRLQRGSRRRSRRSLYRARESGPDIVEMTEPPPESMELTPITRPLASFSSSRRPPRLSTMKKAQSLDQPTVRIGTTMNIAEPTDWNVHRRQGAFRSRSRSHSPGEGSPVERRLSAADPFEVATVGTKGTSEEKSKLL